MTQPAHADPNGGLLKNEPVVVAHFVAWLLLNAGLVLVGRYHVVGTATWNALSSALAPEITAALLALSAWLIRRVVTPAWKLLQGQQASVSQPYDNGGYLRPSMIAQTVDTADADAALAEAANLISFPQAATPA